jgi:hypothetical protein
MIVGGAVSVAGFLAMRGAMNEWRRQVWHSIDFVSPVEQSRRMAVILTRDVSDMGATSVVSRGWLLVKHRSANADLLADVVRRTPDPVPFWDGATFESLEGALIPRIIWPDKPTKTLGQDFGHRYDYLSHTDLHTSVDLPVLIEFYINFGEDGVICGMFIVGLIWAGLERIVNRPGQSYLVTAAGVPLLSQLCIIECDFSMQYGGLIMQCLAFALLFALLRSNSNQTRRRLAVADAPLSGIPRRRR